MIKTKHLMPGEIYQYCTEKGIYSYHNFTSKDDSEFTFKRGDVFTVLTVSDFICNDGYGDEAYKETIFFMNGSKYRTFFKENTVECENFVELAEDIG